MDYVTENLKGLSHIAREVLMFTGDLPEGEFMWHRVLCTSLDGYLRIILGVYTLLDVINRLSQFYAIIDHLSSALFALICSVGYLIIQLLEIYLLNTYVNGTMHLWASISSVFIPRHLSRKGYQFQVNIDLSSATLIDGRFI